VGWGYESNRVFCVVRHPVDKALSKFKMLWGHAKRGHNHTIIKGAHLWLQNIAANYMRWFCFASHMIPQYQFIWDTKGVRTCHHILRFEFVVKDYNDLMITYNKSSKKYYSNKSAPVIRHHKIDNDSLNMSSISKETIQLVEKAYWMDMCLLGIDTEAEGPIIPYDGFSNFTGLNLILHDLNSTLRSEFCYVNHSVHSLF
jgi:hypothetical protein